MSRGCAHDVSRFEVAEDNGRLAHMQVVKHGTELNTDLEYFCERKNLSCRLPQVIVQGVALDKIADQVQKPHFGKLRVNARQVGMRQAGQQQGFAGEGVGGFDKFLLAQAALAHLLDGNQPVARFEIDSLVDGAETTPANLANDTIALVEYLIVDQQSCQRTGPWRSYRILHGLTAAEAELCLCRVYCAAVTTVQRRRNHALVLSSTSLPWGTLQLARSDWELPGNS